MKRFLQAFFYPALSAIIMTAGIPNEVFHFGNPAAGLLALVPLYIGFSKAVSSRNAAWMGAVQFGLVHFLSSFWLANFGDYAIFTLGGSGAVFIAYGFLFGMILYIPFMLSGRPQDILKEQAGLSPSASSRRILLFAFTWTFYEWLKSTGFLAYPWGTLIMTAYNWKVVTQIVSFTGTWGLSFFFAMFSAVVGEGILLLEKHSGPSGKNAVSHSSYGRAAAAWILLAVLIVCHGTFQLSVQRNPVKHVDATLVQHNNDSWVAADLSNINKALDLTEKAMATYSEKPELIVWSESIMTYPVPEVMPSLEFYPYDRPFLPTVRKLNTPLLFGAPYTKDYEENLFYNAAVLLTTDGTIADFYGKQQLVPFAESVPYSETKWMKALMQALVGFSSGWSAGTRNTIFSIPVKDGGTVRFSAPICFEDAFPSVCRSLFLSGSELFINITNDSWSRTASAEYQHFVIASYRAQEFRTTLVRCTNSGYTAVVDPVGNVIASLPIFTDGTLRSSIPVYERETTPYAVLGDWFPLISAIYVIFIYAVYIYRTRSYKRDHTLF